MYVLNDLIFFTLSSLKTNFTSTVEFVDALNSDRVVFLNNFIFLR